MSRSIEDAATTEQRVTSYAYNALGQLVETDGPRTDVQDVTQYTYDAYGNLSTVTNALGYITRITVHDPSGRPLTVVDANGLNTLLTYDGRGRPTQIEQAGDITQLEYDAVGNLTGVIQADGSRLRYHYDPAHRLIAIEDSLGNRINYTLDNMGNRSSTEIVDALGVLQKSSQATYDLLGRVVQSIGAAGQVTEYGYDGEGNPITTTDPLSRLTATVFDELERPVTQTDPAQGVTQYTYDALGNPISVTAPNGVVTHYTYNGFGEVIEEISPDRGTLTTVYDAGGNAVQKTDARGIASYYHYDALSRLTAIEYSSHLDNRQFIWDEGLNSIGRLSWVVGPDGTTSYEYDAKGQLIAQTHSDGIQSSTIRRSYDPAGRISSIEYPSGLIVDYLYDGTGNIASIAATLPSGRLVSLVNDVKYLPFGPLKSITWGNGLVEQRSHDVDYQITGIDLPGLAQHNFQYDPVGNILGIGKPLNLLDEQYFTYDALDRIYDEEDGYGQNVYTYDNNGNRLSKVTNTAPVSYDDSFSNAVGFWKFNQTPGKPYAVNEIQDGVWGTYKNVTLGEEGVFGTTAAYFDGTSRVDLGFNTNYTDEFTIEAWIKPSIVQNESSPDVISKRSYYATSYTDAPVAITWRTGSISSSFRFILSRGDDYVTDLGLGANATPGVWHHVAAVYRANGQCELWINGVLQSSGKFNGVISSNYRNWTVGEAVYERAGGIGTSGFTGAIDDVAIHGKALDGTTIRAHANGAGGFGSGAESQYNYMVNSNQLDAIEINSITRDLAGNRSSDQNGNRTFHYDSAGRLIEIREAGIGVASYTYNHLNQRVSKTLADGSVMHYHHDDSGRLWSETDGQGNALRDYVWMGDIPVAMVEYTGLTERVTYLHADHLNTPRYATDETGTLVWQWSSDAFGNGAPNEDPDGDGTAITLNLRFPGQYYDAESGMHYNWNRYYDPEIGRYITSDPIGLDGGLNTFGYVGGNPVSWSDSQGLQYPGVRNAYFEGMGRALNKYVKGFLGLATVAGTVAATPVVANAAICYSPQIMASSIPIATNPALQQGVVEFAEGLFIPGPPPPTIPGAAGAATGMFVDQVLDIINQRYSDQQCQCR